MTHDSNRVPTRTAIAYGAGQLGAQIFRDTPAVLLPIFMTTILGIPPWLSGFVILIPKLWVIVCDPLVGVFSDRKKETWGRTRFLTVGAILTSIGFASLFTIVEYPSPYVAAGAVCVLFLVASTAFSIFSVPYLAVASELSNDAHERTRILTFRMAATIGGVVIGVGVAQPLVFALGGGAHGWHVMAYSFAVVCIVSMLVPAIGLRGVPLLKSAQAPGKLLDQLGSVASNKPFMVLLATTFIQGIGMASSYTVIGFYYVYALNLVHIIPTFVIAMACGSLLSQPTFLYLSRRFGKEKVYVVGSVLWMLVTVTWFFVEPESPVVVSLPLIGDLTREGLLVLARGVFIGVVNTGFLLLSFSMLTDTVDLHRRRHGSANEGVFSGIFSAAEKLAFALGPLVAGIIMSGFGFVSSTHGVVQQRQHAVLGVILLYSAVPVVTQFLSLLVFSRYRLDPAEITTGPENWQDAARLEPSPGLER
ncbi:MFS transporter [Novosphingobium resinovorum]|uniref:Sugar transporter n=1 Tax=Novosphingobium resinovorum TaxID=158500 RepID=A0A1D8ABM5_9SPHN|nr:MFS transporter [Novosphingobium resinovorum]AOR79518.1 sugar transporter [Novosphingobium resinovorum]